jgi:glutamine synthetase
LTAILGGMLHGLETAPPLGLPIDHPDAQRAQPLGHDWFDAVERFAASDLAGQIFGTEFRDVYAAVKRDEVQTLTGMITPVEYQYYLSRL